MSWRPGWGSRFDSRRVDVAAEARARKTSIEDAARTVRYLFLSEVAAARGATRVAVGHTRNDQAETVLLRLARGAGPVGLAAIYPRAGQVIRPLLDVRRGDVEAWLRERGQTWREDESNQDRTIPRNKVRHELLPWLVEAFGAGVVDVLARQAALSRDDAEWFDLVATETADRLVIEDGTIVTLEQGALGALHPAIARRVVLEALRRTADVGRRSPAAAPSSGSITSKRCWRWARPARARSTRRASAIECRQGRLRFEPRTPDPGREGRRRGRPVPDRRRRRLSPSAGPRCPSRRGRSGRRPAPRRRARGRTQARRTVEMEPRALGGPKCAGSVSLEGHAPKGGRG